MPRTVKFLVAMVLLMLSTAVPAPASATAQDPPAQATPPPPPSFVIAPADEGESYFTLEMEPGSQQELTVVLANTGEQTEALRTYAADAYTLINGGFGVETEDDPVDDVAAWITYEPETIELAPGEQTERTFTVTVPADAEPGQYIAGMVLQTAESIAVGESDMLRQIIKKSIAVFITVPGDTSAALEVGSIQILPMETSSTLVVEVANSGKVYVTPEGEITLADESGETVLTSPITMGTVYAGDTTTLELNIPTALESGTYTISLSLSDPESSASASVDSQPIEVVAAVDATPTVDPITFDTVALTPIPPDGDIQALNVQLTITNAREPVPSGQLTMHVTRDGELVEDYQLNSSLVLPSGSTEIQQRYIPLTGWEPGTYGFAFTLEAVDPNTGQITTLATHDAEATIEVP